MAAVVVLVDEFVAEKAGFARAGVGNEGLVCGEFQREFCLNKGSDGLLDDLGFVPWAGKSQEIPVGSGTCRQFPGGARPAPADPNPACTISIHQAHPSTLNAMQFVMAGDTDPL